LRSNIEIATSTIEVLIIVLVVSADGSWNFDARRHDENVSDSRHELFIAVPV